jgi:hypothetical protein
MEKLTELVELISLNKVKHINVVGMQGGQFSMLERFFRTIHAKRFESEEEAVQFFYGDNENPNLNFTRLKKRLFKRLLNTLFFIDVNQPAYSDIQKAYYTCYKDFAALKILLGKGARKSVKYLGDKILAKSIKFEFTDLTVNVLRVLRLEYGSIHGDQKKFKEYNAWFHQYSEILRAEDLAEEYYTALSSHFVKSSASKTDLIKIAQEYAEKLEGCVEIVNTQRFILLSHLVFVYRYQIMNDYQNTLRVSQEALKKFEIKGDHALLVNKFTFMLKVATSQIQLRRFSEAEVALDNCKKLMPEGSFNWFVTQEVCLLLAYHEKDYQKGWEIFTEAKANPKFKNLTSVHAEKWAIHEAFLSYFVSLGKINIGKPGQAIVRKFKMGKFHNEVPVYSNDKKGWNISILIIQVLFLISQKKVLTDEIETRLDALKFYAFRHLRHSDTFRTQCFIQMLLQLPVAHYNQRLMVVRAAKYADKLKSVPIEIAGQSEEIELVPYEDLWQLVLDSLKP